MIETELTELQKEWRREVADSLRELRKQNLELLAEVREMRDQFAKQRDLDKLAERVTTLEGERSKMVGAVLVLQFIGGIAVWLITKYWK